MGREPKQVTVPMNACFVFLARMSPALHTHAATLPLSASPSPFSPPPAPPSPHTRMRLRAGVPVFLANAALSGWIKWQGFQLPALLITVLLGLGILQLSHSSSSYIAHLVSSAHAPQVHEVRAVLCWGARSVSHVFLWGASRGGVGSMLGAFLPLLSSA